MDSQGRFNPTELREKAALERDITFIGTVNRIEVWAAENVSETEVEDMKNANRWTLTFRPKERGEHYGVRTQTRSAGGVHRIP